MLNATQKRDKVLSLLNKWFPQMEKFEGQMKKYQRTIDLLDKENVELEEKAKDGNSNKIKTQLEMNKLKIEVNELRRFQASIPPDLLKELKTMQKYTERAER